MAKYEVCYVDTLHHTVAFLTPEGLKETKIKKDKANESDSKDHATARFVAELGRDGWMMTNGSGDVRPVLFFRREIAE